MSGGYGESERKREREREREKNRERERERERARERERESARERQRERERESGFPRHILTQACKQHQQCCSSVATAAAALSIFDVMGRTQHAVKEFGSRAFQGGAGTFPFCLMGLNKG